MRNLLNSKWIFLINTLPLLILFILFFGEFNIIKSLLNEESINLWKSFGLTLGILSILNFLYAVHITIKKKEVSFLYGVLALLCYIPFIYLYGYLSDKIIPSSIPQWMIPGNMILYVGTFLMPTLAYSLLVLVSHFTAEAKEYKAWKNFLIAILVPISWYLFTQVILPLWKPVEDNFSVHILLIFIIIGTLIFLFFIVRGLLIIATKKSNIWLKYQLAWKIPISIILPILGLAVNNGYLFNNFTESNSGIFGNFNNFWFFLIATINGILMCLPNFKSNLYRIILFIGRSITFAFTLYFFLIFLPFLPLSVIAIVAIGTGFLMLTPLFLFVIHINELSKDFAYINNIISKKMVWSLFLISFFVIPIFITNSYLKDKRVLNKTLDYIYNSDYSKNYKIDEISLKRTLEVIKHHKDNNRDFLFGTQIPYLSSYFNWLVLDNLTLSETKINMIERIFFSKTSVKLRPENIQNDDVNITNISSESFYDKTQNTWISWVNLEITNKNGNNRFSEYATTIELPVGCWISDYYLFVDERKEMGVLAEKKSAMWVFSQIRNENRDPGILYYLTGNKVAFRVFPFAQKEIRNTGIEFMHKEPIKLTIDGNSIELGNMEVETTMEYNTDGITYISTKQKQSLRQVQRKPYFHFLVDVSKEKDKILSDFTNRIDQVTESHKELSENAKISFVNSYVTTELFDENWKQNLQSQSFNGGFYLDRAIKKTLFNSYKEQSKSYPVIIVVTDSINQAVLDKDFSDFDITFPESNLFYNLKDNGDLEPHSLTSNPFKPLSEKIRYSFSSSVLEYKHNDNSISYLANNYKPSIILNTDVFETTQNEINEKKWETALIMQGMWLSQILHPETSDKEWLNLVKYSFLSKVMTPLTSYIVVENEAQKAILEKKQRQVLSGNRSLDVGDETQRMSEPSFIILLALLIIALWIGERRKKKSQIIKSCVYNHVSKE